MIHFPRTLGELTAAKGVIRGGGTDLALIRRLGMSAGDLVDLRDCEGLDAIAIEGDMLRIGARARVAAVASHPLREPRRVAGALPGGSALGG